MNGTHELKRRRVLSCDAGTYVKRYIDERKASLDSSPTSVLARILEQLGRSDGKINELLKSAEDNRDTSYKQALLKRRKIPRALRRADLPAAAPTEEDELAEFFPRFVKVRGYVTPRDMAQLNAKTILRSSIITADLNRYYPRWADEHYSDIEHTLWFNWTAKNASKALCVAAASGSGITEDEWVCNSATWAFDFTADATEQLDVWLTHSISGYCEWHSPGWQHYVSLWLLHEVFVDKWVPPPSGAGPWTYEEIGSIPLYVDRLYSNNSSLAMDGPPPQGYFGGSPTAGVPTASVGNGDLRVALEEGWDYTVYSGLTICLTANHHAAIGVGRLAGTDFLPFVIKGGIRCFLCRLD